MTTDTIVVFDIGNVLIEWVPERYYDAKIGEARRKALFSEVDLHWMNERVDRGEGFRDIIYETADAYPAWRPEIRDWHDNWLSVAGPAIPQSVQMMRRLQENGTPVHALTNFGIDSFALAQTKWDFLSEFDMAHVSGHMGVTKPSARIYEMVEEATGASGDTFLFADDRPANVAAAAERGWRAHLFDGPQGWAERLVAEGLLSAERATA